MIVPILSKIRNGLPLREETLMVLGLGYGIF
jgi:hypothetical protein